MMRVKIDIEEAVLRELMQLTEAESRTKAVNRAIVDWVRRKRIDQLRARRGQIAWGIDPA